MKRYVVFFFMCFLWGHAQEDTIASTTICWDTSYSMFERNLEEEFVLLEKIFQRTPNQNVQLLLFNVQVEEHQFSIRNGDWSVLKTLLINAKADGATRYGQLADKIKNEMVYYFTDGNTLVSNDFLPVKKGHIIINSLENRDEGQLQKMALLGKGRLMDLAAILPKNIGEKESNRASEKERELSGTVYLDNAPAGGFEVRVPGNQEVYRTDANGKFKIPVVAGDSILISSREYRTMKTVPVGYFNSNVDVFLEANITALNEVVVTEQRVEANTRAMVTTGTGLRDKESVGYAVQSIGDKQITEVNTDASTAVSGKFSGVNLSTGQDLTTFSTRVNTSMLGNNYGLIIVDGTPIQRSNSSASGRFNASGSFIDPNNIAEVTVLKGFAATNRYGSEANNGVLLITTKNALYAKGAKEPINSALARNNIYDPKSKIVIKESAITKALKSTGDIAKAYEKYLSLRNYNVDNPSFFMDSFDFFKGRDKDLAFRIISNLWEQNPKNVVMLRTVELAARATQNWNASQRINKSLSELKPTDLQPFFTEAQLHLEYENWQQALNNWNRLAKGGQYGTMDVSAIKKSIDREIKNLVLLQRANLDVTQLSEALLKKESMNVRIRLEWNDPKAEFQIQFVNPQNRFFNWEHTTSANPERLQKEIEQGFAIEEFELYDDLKGDWKLNVHYLGHMDTSDQQPLVVLCSIYTNFGTPSQRRELIWLYLDNQNPRKGIISFKI
jgi:TonB-dependent SusC/RagA subfamily outer membrane receptor